MKKYFKSINFTIGFVLVSILFGLLVLSFFYMPYDPLMMNQSATFKTPSSEYFLGTDNFGRDIFSRVLEGSKVTFLVGSLAVSIGLILGMSLGALAGYYGGIIDDLIMRIISVLMAFPGIILALVFITVFGSSTVIISVALGILAIPRFCRITRSGFLQAKEMEYIKAARCRGCSDIRIMIVHILPNITSSLIVTTVLSFSSAVLAEAGLSYLGLGIPPPHPSWGKMIYESQAFFLTNPWYAIVPGVLITILVLGLNMLGDGLQDIYEGRINE